MLDKVHYIHCGQWPVYIGFTVSSIAFEREMKRLKIGKDVSFLVHGNAAATTHFFINKRSLCCIIAMSPPSAKQNKAMYAALLAHEALHVIQEMRDELNKGQPFGNESESYLLQMIVQECLMIAWFNRPKSRQTQPC
jgi:hypothetical protein